MDFVWQNVTVNVINKNKNFTGKYKKLVDSSSGQVRTGELLAIMGPSGGGKTTLLNTLSGRVPPGSKTSGIVTFDNKRREDDIKEWISKVGFVDQDDTVFEKLTVEETVYYAGKFRSNYKTDDELRQRVDDMLKAFQIGHISKNQMGKISGGERKRTMIAIELIADPDIIFLDEPTSGLDSPKAKVIVDMLKKLAHERNKLIVLTIHQPSAEIFAQFDKLILLNDGKTVYNGVASECEAKLASMGASRRETQSFPEFLVKFVSTNLSYAESTQYGSVIRELEKEYHNTENSEVYGKEKSSNESYIDYMPNISHVSSLIRRRYRLESRGFIKILKAMGVKIVIVCILLPFLAYQYNNWTVEIKDKSILNNLNDTQVVALVELTSDIYRKIAMYWFSYVLIVVSEISMVALSFFDEHAQIRREMGVGTYSAMSYYFFIFIYNLINCLCINAAGFAIMAGLLYKMLTPVYVTGVLYFIFPFFTIAFGIFIGSITSNKRFLTYAAPLLGFMCAVPSGLVYLFLVIYKYRIWPSSFDWAVLSYLLAFSPLYPLNSLYERYLVGHFYRYVAKKMKDDHGFESKKIFSIAEHRKSDILNLVHFPLVLNWLLGILPSIAIVLFSFYMMGRLKQPRMRLQLQKS